MILPLIGKSYTKDRHSEIIKQQMEKMYTIVSMILFLFMESGVFCSTFGIISPISPQGNFNIWIWPSRIVAPPIHLMSHLYTIHLGHLCVISSFISQPVFFVEQLASLNKMKDIR